MTKEDLSKSPNYPLWRGPLNEVVSSPNPEIFQGRDVARHVQLFNPAILQHSLLQRVI